MGKINWIVRIKNPVFWFQIGAAIVVPVMAYSGLSVNEITTWSKLLQVSLEAISNPYVLGLAAVSVFNAIQDPTTSGIFDSKKALTYKKPSK